MKNAIAVVGLIIVSLSAVGQSVPFDKAHIADATALKRAQESIKAGDKLVANGGQALGLALTSYEGAYGINPDNAELNMKMGLCHLNGAQRHLALPYFQAAAELAPEMEGVHFFVGYAQQLNSNWDKAVEAYEKHKRSQATAIGEADPRMANIEKLMVECRNGRALSASVTSAVVTAMGPSINSEQADYGVLLSAASDQLLFTSRRASTTGGKINKATQEYFEDIYATTRMPSGFTAPQPLLVPVNSIGNDATVCLSHDLKTLLLYRDVSGSGDVLRCDLTPAGWSEPKPLGPNINTRQHEGSAWLTADGQWLYFVSDRTEESLGGQDIYRSRFDAATNDWGVAENLGPDVNSAFDEDGVFVSVDGNTIWFSSKGHNSIGGYDVFVSHYENGFWTKAKSMGMPINSPDDDLYFVLADDGMTGYFSSVRPGGEGQDDIYRIDLSPGAGDTGKTGR